MSSIFRFAVIVLSAAIIAFGIYGITGTSHNPQQTLITSGSGVHQTVLWVRPGSNPDKAGLRAGDVIDNSHISAADYRAHQFSRTGQHVSLAVIRGQTHRTVAFTESTVPAPRTPERSWIGFAIVVFGVITALLVGLRRAERPEARLLSVFILSLAGGTVLNWLQTVSSTPLGSLVSALAQTISYTIANYGLIVLSATLPNVPSPLRRALRWTAWPLTITFVAFSALVSASYFTPYAPLADVDVNNIPIAFFMSDLIGNLAVEGISIIACIDGLLRVDREHRAQMNWVAAGFITSGIAWLVPAVAILIAPAWILPGHDWISLFFNLPLIIALPYVVLRHRLIDLSIVVSRAAVFGTVSIVVVSAFVLGEWLIGKFAEDWLPQGSHGVAGQAIVLAVALAIGLSVRTIHTQIERRLNDIFFARRARSLANLRRFAHETDVVIKGSALLRLFFETVRANTEATYAALYLRDGGTFVLAHGSSPELPQGLDEDDPAVVQLRRWNEPYEHDRDAHALSEALVIPVTVHGTLFGILVCGPKKERTHYASEEVDVLAQAAHRTAIAYVFLSHLSVMSGAPLMAPA